MMELSKKISPKAFRRAPCYNSGPDNPELDAFGLDFSGFSITFSDFQTAKLTPPLVMS